MKILNRILFAVSCATALLIVAGCKTASPGKASAIELFNGQNYAGWTFCMRDNADPMQTWSVKDGVMCCTGQPYGYARTVESYRDYTLTCIWRFVKIAPHADDSGIFVYLQLPDKVWPTGYQCQGKYGRQGDIMLGGDAIADDHMMKSQKNAKQMGPANENPAGEWNTNVVICSGSSIKLSINGKQMNQITGCNYTNGFVGIQSEGGEIEVRKMTLEPL